MVYYIDDKLRNCFFFVQFVVSRSTRNDDLCSTRVFANGTRSLASVWSICHRVCVCVCVCVCVPSPSTEPNLFIFGYYRSTDSI